MAIAFLTDRHFVHSMNPASREHILNLKPMVRHLKIKIAVTVLALLYCTLAAQAQHEKKGHEKNAALDRFAQLAGEWVGKGMHGGKEQEIRIVYKVTAGGSAVVETIDPGSVHEMVTVIHADGDALAVSPTIACSAISRT